MEAQNHEQSITNEDVTGMDGVASVQSTSNSADGSQLSQMYHLVTEEMSPSNLNMSASMSSVSRGRSKVWNEFAVTGDGKKVTCRQCGDSLSYSHSHSTSSMLKHLKRKHNMDLYPHTGEEDGFKPSPQLKSQERPTKKAVKAKKLSSETFQEESMTTEPSIQHDPLMFADPCVRMRWADHSDTFLRTFSVMYNDESYTDCTLVAEKQFFKAHRVILSSASDMFDEMFKMTPSTQHPLIFLKDVKAMELRILLDFIYKGEVAIPPSLIPGLVKVGGELKVKGLSDFVWNDQLASSIFQGYQNMDNRQQPQHQQPQQHHVSPSQMTNVQQSFGTIIPNTSTTSPGKMINSFRVSPNKQLPNNATTSMSTNSYTTDKNSQSNMSSAASRTFTRVLSNVRSVNVLQNQNIGVLGDGTAILNQGGSGLKRIRILTASSIPTTKASLNSIPTRFDGSHSDLGMECDNAPETVLMVTNQGETVLSTSQGGVTVMTPNSLPLPMGITVKDERGLDSHTAHHLHNEHMNSHPITILSGSGTSGHDLEEVVYSITEVPGGGHEILMSGAGEGLDQESIVVYGTHHQQISSCETQDRKPFQLSLHKT